MHSAFSKWRFVLIACLFALAAFWLSRDAIASFLHQRGLKAKAEWQLQSAIGYFDWSLFLSETFDSRFEKGACLQLRGNFLASQKEFDALFKTRIADNANLSRLHNAIGVNQYSFAQPDAAAVSHRRALELAQSAGDRRLEAEALIDLSRVFYHSLGKFDDAIANLEQARIIAREISDERIEAAAIRNIGVVYWWFKAELDRPLKEFYSPALDLYRRQNDRRGEATMLTLIALVFNNKGDVYRFMQYQNESIEIQERIGDEAGLSDSYMAMGQLYGGIGNYRKAREFYEKSLAIAERNGYRLARIDLEALLAGVLVNLDEYDEAIKLYDPSSKHKNEDSELSNYDLQSVGYCYQLKGDHAQALTLYERALQVHDQAGLPDVRFRANALLRSAECSISLGNRQRASEFMAQADEIFQTTETHSEGAIQPAIVRATLARHEGRNEQALEYFQDALDVERQIFSSAKTNFLIPPHRRSYESLFNFLLDYSVSNVDGNLSGKANELAFGFLENMRYRSLRNFLIQVREKRAPTTPTNKKEHELAERIKRLSQNLKQNNSEATREQLRRTYNEFEDLTLKAQLEQPQYLAIRESRPIALSELQPKLSPETALVEFLFVGEEVFALVVTQKSVQSVLLPISKSNLGAKAKVFRSVIFTSEENDWLPVATSLRAALIEPIERSGALTGIERIGFVPYGFLHDLPFAALAGPGGANQRFLVEDYVLFQTPSATFYANNTEDNVSNPQSGRTAAFGRNDFPEENLPSLKFASEEANTVAQATGGAAFTNDQATETELKQVADACDFLHLSTHAVAENEMPLLSRLLLEPTNTDDGNLTVREIFELGLRTKLVTLSACETGQSFSASGNDFVEQDRIGLIDAFLHAGSKSVMASLFPVSDRATTEFMRDFYTNLREKDKVESLALTQRAMIHGQISTPENNLKHPRFWSPFILVGTDR